MREARDAADAHLREASNTRRTADSDAAFAQRAELESGKTTARQRAELEDAVRAAEREAARVAERSAVGPGRYCSPRHRTHCKPSFRELNVASYDGARNIHQAREQGA